MKPKKARVLTCGQPVTSSAKAADHAFISSEILGREGRCLFVGFTCLLRRRFSLHEQDALYLVAIQALVGTANFDNDLDPRDRNEVAS